MAAKELIDVKLANAVRVDGSEEVFFHTKLFDIKLHDWKILHVTKRSNGADVWSSVANIISWHMEKEDDPKPTTAKAAGPKK